MFTEMMESIPAYMGGDIAVNELFHGRYLCILVETGERA